MIFLPSRLARPSTLRCVLSALCVLCALTVTAPSSAFAQISENPSKDIKSSNVLMRLAAIEALDMSTKGADKLLLRAMKDKDWEVREMAARKIGEASENAAIDRKSAAKALAALSLTGAVRRMRRAAARSLGRVEPQIGSKALESKLKGKTTIRALEAMSALFTVSDTARANDKLNKKLQKLMKHKDAAVREAAARACFAASKDREAAFAALLAKGRVLAAAALDAIAADPRAGDLDLLSPQLLGKARNEVLERRMRRAATAACIATGDKQTVAASLLKSLSKSALLLLRRARILPQLLAASCLEADAAREALGPCLSCEDARVRAAAARALREIQAGEEGADLALARLAGETNPRVRFQLIQTIVALRGLDKDEHIPWLGKQMRGGDLHVRTLVATLLGRAGDAPVPSLLQACKDQDWRVAVTAIVSLGKTRSDAALDMLRSLTKSTDWRRRGAAIVAWMHFNRKESVAPLLAALEDKNGIVQRSAHEGLAIVGYTRDVENDAKAWRAWWKERLAKHSFIDRAKEKAEREKYGYAVDDRLIYAGLDVVVLQSRGDHIEKVLERLDVKHRRTMAAKVPEAALHPEAICVVNCTGEIEAVDVEPIAWFVHTGGALFGSCWALSQTIQRIFPGVLAKYATSAEVLDDVRAYACRSSKYLTGVFPAGVRPIYHLEGAHLIQVVDPERAEVLIDSPDAAERHGSGELAAWFRVGHGLVMDSVNHFDLQGLARAQRLKKPVDRQAYAIDHMGMTYTDWRRLAKKKFWSSTPRAAGEVPDLSAFRFLTNFVRAKRSGQMN